MDLRSGFRFYSLDFGKPVTGLGVIEGELKFVHDGKLCDAFSGDDLELTYVSPTFTDGYHALRKNYNKIFIRYSGSFEVTFFIDDVEVSKKNISGSDTAELTPPVGKKSGYNCSFKISGKGVVYTIAFDFSAPQIGERREDG